MRLSTVNIQTQTAFDLFDLHIIYMDFRSNEFNLLWFLISCVWHSLPQVQTNVGWNPFWPTTSIFNNYSNYSTTGHEISSNKLQCCSFLIAMILCPVLGLSSVAKVQAAILLYFHQLWFPCRRGTVLENRINQGPMAIYQTFTCSLFDNL